MIKRPAATLAAVIALLVGGISSAAAADVEATTVPYYRYDSSVVQVVAAFPYRGSGWQVARAIDAWNSAQTTVRFTRSYTPGAAVVHLRRYFDDSRGAEYGKTVWSGWTAGRATESGVWVYHEATVYLNVAYKPRLFNCGPYLTTAHELGHALGLQHSDDLRSVMHPDAGLIGHYCPKPQPSDAAALATLYAS